MEKIGFIGVHDKMDIMLYIAKILTSIGKKVLIVDTTITQKGRYVVPAIKVTKTCITEFEGFDVAVGLYSYEELEKYMDKENENIGYDIMLVDIDAPETIKKFDMDKAKINYFVSAFDSYSLRRGLEILSELSCTVKLKKVLFTRGSTEEEEEYLDFLSLGMKIVWAEERIFFPCESEDYSVIIENQMVSRIRFRKLSMQYKESLIYMAEEIVEPEDRSKIRKEFRQLDKEI